MARRNALDYDADRRLIEPFDLVEFTFAGRDVRGRVIRIRHRECRAVVAFRRPEPRPVRRNGNPCPRICRISVPRRHLRLVARDDCERSIPR